MKLLILTLKVFGIAFGITAGIVLAMCGIYLLSCAVIAFIEFVDGKTRRK